MHREGYRQISAIVAPAVRNLCSHTVTADAITIGQGESALSRLSLCFSMMSAISQATAARLALRTVSSKRFDALAL